MGLLDLFRSSKTKPVIDDDERDALRKRAEESSKRLQEAEAGLEDAAESAADVFTKAAETISGLPPEQLEAWKRKLKGAGNEACESA